MPVIADIWEERCSGSVHGQDVRHMLNALAQMCEALDCPDYVLPPETQATFEESATDFLHFYRSLHTEARDNGVKRWHEVPKFHFLQHIITLNRYMNPRHGWCYPDEDFMRIMKVP